jgi:branched-chain amino acid transport system permease protein
VATLSGPIIGAFAIPLLMEYLQFLAEYRMIIFGVLLIVVIIYFPRGLMGGWNALRERAKAFYGSKRGEKSAAGG